MGQETYISLQPGIGRKAEKNLNDTIHSILYTRINKRGEKRKVQVPKKDDRVKT